jgi:hypothetical protein
LAEAMHLHDGDWAMLYLWLDIPPSAAARTITVQQGEPLLPAPFHLDESDLTPDWTQNGS